MPGATIYEIVEAWAERTPDASAIGAVDGPAISYADLARLIDARAADLAAAGISPSDRVALSLPNGPEMATTFLSVSRVGTAAPLNPALTESEFEFYLEDLEARMLILAADDPSPGAAAASSLRIPVVRVSADRLRPGVFTFGGLDREHRPGSTPGPDSIALVLHTSGTTARPKIVPLSHRNLCSSADHVATTLQLSPGDVCLNVMPLFHIHGLVAALLATMSSGGRVICTGGFEAPPFLGWLEQHEATWFTAVPTMHQAILARARSETRPARNHQLRFARSSSASLAPPIIEELESLLGVPVIEAYGMTEAAHQMASNPLDGIRKPGSVGPAAGPEVAIADPQGNRLDTGAVGEVVIRGPNVTAGYHGIDDLSAFHDDGWFRTGDQGYLDEDGYLFLTGRLKEIINRGGETIAPREIDEALLAVDGVRQAIAFAVDDPVLGEEVAAAVVLDEEGAISEEELRQELAKVLSLAKVPKRIVFVDDIPKGPTGKLQRIGLAEKLGITGVPEPAATGPVASRTTVDTVTRIWETVLELETIGPDTPFLESGGDSITATALAATIEDAFDIDLPLLAFYDAATIRRQAVLIDELLDRADD